MLKVMTRPAWYRAVIVAALISAVGVAAAQETPVVAFPAYKAEVALQGLYTHLLPPLWQSFNREANELTQASLAYCSGRQGAIEVRNAWSRARIAWVAASNPTVGPTVERRSQREIDFWPARPTLLQRALADRPTSLEDMKRVGSPAKGFPAMEALLAAQPSPVHCPYLVLLAEAIAQEASALTTAYSQRAAQDWSADEALARSAYGEWVNQWLGGLELLRWQQIEQPLQKARTSGSTAPPSFARQTLEDNRNDWVAQWSSLRAQARLAPEVRRTPPAPGQAIIPIEALLLGKGRIELATRWAQAIDTADTLMTRLPAQPSERDLQSIGQALKRIAALYQNEVAGALDVPLGFSSADGD